MMEAPRVLLVPAWFLGFAQANLPVTQELIGGLYHLRLPGPVFDVLFLHDKIPPGYR